MSKSRDKKLNIAIVLGPKCVNATGLIRSLGEVGFYVIFASTYSKIESKYLSGYFRLPDNFDEQLDALTDFIKTLPKKPFIYTVDDKYNFLLDENYERLSKIAFIPHANGKLKEVSDKAVMADLAYKSGLTVPKTIKIDLHNINDLSFKFPVILKPYAGFAGSKGDIKICRLEKEFKKAIDGFKSDGYKKVLCQELIDGKDKFEIGLMGISLESGEVIIPATIRKIRSYPVDRGSTSYAKIIGGIPYVDKEKLENFVRSTGYVGLFDIELIISDGKAYFIEINYRNGQYGYSVTKAGYNLPCYWAKGCLGEDVPENLPISEIYYMNERDDKLHVKNGYVSKKQWKKEFKSASAFGTYCKGDNRPFIRQYVKIPDRIKIACKKIKNRIKDLLIKEEWTVAIRKKKENLLFENKNFDGFKVLKNTFRYWCADPFIIDKDRKSYLFFEAYDRFKAKGFIGYREITDKKVGKVKKAIVTPYHMSFPYIFSCGDDVYMMPESYSSKKLTVYKAVEFPSKWKVEEVILNESVCDSVFLESGDKTYLLTSKISTADTELYAYEKTSDGYMLVSDEPIVIGKDVARNGGKIINYNGKLLRVSQDCKKGYGLALNFSTIKIDKGIYSEDGTYRVELKDLPKKLGKKYVGIHTYNKSEKYEVIDFKLKNRFRLGNFINLFYRIFR